MSLHEQHEERRNCKSPKTFGDLRKGMKREYPNKTPI